MNKPHSIPPSNYQGVPGLGSSRQAVGAGAKARVVDGQPAAKQTHKESATITVTTNRRARPTVELLRQIGVKHGHVVDLIPPKRRGPWILDIHPRAGGCHITHTGDIRPQFDISHHLGRAQMTVCTSVVLNEKGNRKLVCEARDKVELVLLGEDPNRPGIFFFRAR